MNKTLALGLILTVAAFIGCASHDTSRSDRDESNQIVEIKIDNDSDSLNLNIQVSQSLNFTEDIISNPKGIVFSFPDTEIDGLRGLYTPPENEVIRYIRADAYAVSESPVATVYIALKAETQYGVIRDNGRLQVTFPMQPTLSKNLVRHDKPAEEKPKPQEVQKLSTATVLVKVNAESHEDALAVDVVADGTIANYNVFTLDEPARIVFDIFKIQNLHSAEQKIRVQSKVARQIRYCSHPDKLRLVIDTQEEYLSKYSSISTDTGLIIKVGKLQE